MKCDCGKVKHPDLGWCQWCRAKMSKQANKWKQEAKEALKVSK